MAAFMDESGVNARIGYLPIRGILRLYSRIIKSLLAPFQNIQFPNSPILNSLIGQQWNANHFNTNLAKAFINGFTKRGGGAVMR